MERQRTFEADRNRRTPLEVQQTQLTQFRKPPGGTLLAMMASGDRTGISRYVVYRPAPHIQRQ